MLKGDPLKVNEASRSEPAPKEHCPIIVIGHYGSGKTEFVLNYAIKLASTRNKVRIADLDVVNPYFRAREAKETLLSSGIELYASNLGAENHMDMPAIAAGMKNCFYKSEVTNMIDIGGDSSGAKVLGSYRNVIPKGYHMWMVINPHRPKTSSLALCKDAIDRIQKASSLTINGLINNTNLLEDTTANLIYEGESFVNQLSKETHIPIEFTMIPEVLAGAINEDQLRNKILWIKPFLNDFTREDNEYEKRRKLAWPIE